MAICLSEVTDLSDAHWPAVASKKPTNEADEGNCLPLEEGKACFKLFSFAGPQMPTPRLHALCAAVWNEEPALCLALIFWMGSVDAASEERESNECGEDKGRERMQRFTFYRAMLWLFNTHPETFLLNVCFVPVHASLGALLDLLMFTFHQDGKSKRRYGLAAVVTGVGSGKDWRSSCSAAKLQDEFQTFLFLRNAVFGDLRVAGAEKDKKSKTEASASSSSLQAEHRERFYWIVADVFASGLEDEMREWKAGGVVGGQFGVQAPSSQRMHDTATDIVDGIAQRLLSSARKAGGRVEGRV
eukprot:1550137-Rhodomonas_salina.1